MAYARFKIIKLGYNELHKITKICSLLQRFAITVKTSVVKIHLGPKILKFLFVINVNLLNP
jgi:hypothetical protein